MYEIDTTRIDLPGEFLADPFGRHSGELERLKHRLRLPVGPAWVVVECPDGRFAIALVRPEPQAPELLAGEVYRDVADAARALFFLQWEAAVGRPLPLPKPPSCAEPPPVLPEKTIVGYSDRLSARGGDDLALMVHTEDTDVDCTARLVRLTGAAGFPTTSTLRRTPVDGVAVQRFTGRPQTTRPGSYVIVEPAAALDDLAALPAGFTVQVAVRLHARLGRRQALLGTFDEAHGTGWALALDEADVPQLLVGPTAIRGAGPLTPGTWTVVSAVFDSAAGSARIVQVPLAQGPGARVALTAATSHTSLTGCAPGASGRPFLLGAWWRDGEPAAHLDGRLARPRIVGQPLDDDALAALHHGGASPESLVAAWDLGADPGSTHVRDRGPRLLHGRTVNGPLRAVAGPAWSGAERTFRHAPDHYDAIELHDRDLTDARWEVACSLRLPEDLASGVYAIELQDGTSNDDVVVFVRPAPKAAAARVAFLAPTASYLAYGNYRLVTMGAGKHLSEGSMPLVAAGQLFLHRHPELGGSTYDYHADGRGTHHSSRLRPLLNIRPEAPFWALTGFPADTHVTAWLEHSGERFDVLTDEDLHHEGPSLLHPYRVVVTGTHPEYYSTAMLDALDAYLDHGGRLMYLGGNGFYWRIGFPEANPGVIEVRRGEHGTGAWHDEPGEDTLASTGEPAGLWARNRRPPHALVGVGFAAQGFDSAAPYRVRRSARRSRAAWILAGVDDDVIGDHGAIGGGAAGWEIDRADPAHGTPAHAVVLASSFGHTATYRHVIEELPLNLGLADGIQDPNVRSDVVFFETPRGGAVFSVGSMTWATSLADGGYDNAVCTVTDNVLRRFVDPEPFPAPTPP